MNRRWQKDAVDQYRTIESFDAFLTKLPPLERPLGICDTADLYATLSVLHSKARNPQLHANRSPGFYYFLADAVQSPQQQVAGGDAAAAPVLKDDGPRFEAVVPVSSKSLKLTCDTLYQLFHLEAHPNTAHIMLAIADDDGSVSLMRLFNYVQPPFEGPETLPPLQTGPDGEESDG